MTSIEALNQKHLLKFRTAKEESANKTNTCIYPDTVMKLHVPANTVFIFTHSLHRQPEWSTNHTLSWIGPVLTVLKKEKS